MTPADPNPAREADGRASRDALAKLIHAAETDAPMKWRPMDSLATHIKAAEDRAAARGRDEALAETEFAAKTTRSWIASRTYTPSVADAFENFTKRLAVALDEAGGDGR